MQVFLSYARGDAINEADLLQQQLTNAKRPAWLDRHDLEAGKDWWEKASSAIVGADAFVLLITPESMKSEPVKRECELALTLKKHFIPVLVKDTQVPAELKVRTYRDLTGIKYANGLSKLIGDLTGIWEQLKKNLVDTRIRPAGSAGWRPLPQELAVLAEKLEGHAAANVRPPEVFETFTELLKRFRDDAAQTSLKEVLDDFFRTRNVIPADQVIDKHWEFFADLLDPIKQGLSAQQNGQPVPVVLVAMTREQAEELEAGTALVGAPQDVQQNWASVRTELGSDWTKRYGAGPQEWKPYENESLRQLVEREVKALSKTGLELYPRFYDVETLNDESARADLRALRYLGCVVLIDILSIFHPKVHQAYMQSMLCVQQKAILVQVSSIGKFPNLTEVTVIFRKRLDLEFYARVKMDRDRNCKRCLDEVDLVNFLANEMAGVLPDIKPMTGPLAFIQRTR